ncbi:uncharacterized protein BCN122_III0493 [Burkholderia cenocepacia]|nr:uncharacterized protein BCN122_III0493 [Burkholderia cenocepacia]
MRIALRRAAAGGAATCSASSKRHAVIGRPHRAGCESIR